MGNKIKTEADRRATPRVPAPAGVTLTTGHGQKVSKERGSHTRSKKNPGKRAHKGGAETAPCGRASRARRSGIPRVAGGH